MTPPATSPTHPTKSRTDSTARLLFRSAIRDPLVLISIAWIAAVAIAIVFRPWLLPAQYQDAVLANRLLPPLSADPSGGYHLLGTDALGRDYLTQLIAGTSATVLPALTAAVIGLAIGIVIGSVAGYFGGRVDALLLRVIEFQMAFPSLLLALLILASMGPSITVLVIVLALGAWTGLARVARALALELRELAYIDSAKVLGGSQLRIIVSHIAPNLFTPVMVLGTLEVASLMLSAAGLDFLGLGVQPPETSWGQQVSKGRETLTTAWWLVVIPGLAIFMTTLAVNLVAVWIRNSVDLDQRALRLAQTAPKRPSVEFDPDEAPEAPRPGVAHGSNSTPDAVLEVRDLWVDFATERGVAKAVRGVSWGVGRGEVLAIVGESGSGKSVTARAIMGILERPQARVRRGAIEYDGTDLLTLPPKQRRAIYGNDIAMVQQDALAALNPSATIAVHLIEVIRAHQPEVSKADARTRAGELLAQVGIPDPAARLDDFPHQFSGGMRQRVLIAMAIANSPAVLIADEPTTALDVTVQAQIVELLLELRRTTGMSIVLITHDLSLVAEAADRVVVMYAGRVMECGNTAEVIAHSAHPYTRQLLAATPDVMVATEHLRPIPGAPPSPIRVPSGCPFHPRCTWARDICKDTRPEQIHLSATRSSTCHFAEEVVAP
ncbi:dipeptide/oligopeptide/nickel ABC transporter permease/ATP-binding protein [Rhodococcoides kyotonense]|uniref:Peptide/nickel transport system permease protein n=1 Tax=Rhodococcoides kyotonense TaxID=398843 RepID=A0A239N0Y3_9NOCA|nr:dipeptide/oligopeptide/nickel ABC transporter permease/ATP-binding protein [Rhodococcus kyotonensis]SNT48565.1 peptide/nickel transport system permease protein [Rhodococcus kyotonensis]